METIVCSCCGQELPVTEFYKQRNKNGKIQYKHQCKKCYNEMRKTDEARKKNNEASLRHYYRNKERRQKTAHRAVSRALANGKLVRPTTCSRCGCECLPFAHHVNGYDKENELNIIWLCPACHGEEHAHHA